MTNRGIAEGLIGIYYDVDDAHALVSDIEKVLNEAEKRGFNKAKAEIIKMIERNAGDWTQGIKSMQPDLEGNRD